jgi:hypothetical protein
MIRPTKLEDKAALLTVANPIGFQPNDLEALSKMLADYFSDNSDRDRFWITDDDDDDGPVGGCLL